MDAKTMNAQIEQVLSTIQSMDERSQMEVADRIVEDLASHSPNNKLWLEEAKRRLEIYEPGSGMDSDLLFEQLRKKVKV